MSGVKLEYQIDTKRIQAAFDRLGKIDTHSMFDEIGGHLDNAVLQRFNSGVGPDGIAWEPSERALNEGGKTLVDYGHLRDSITHNTYAHGVEHGSNMVYAAIHQFGGKTGRNKSVTMIARPFIGISADDEIAINEIVEDFLQEALSR